MQIQVGFRKHHYEQNEWRWWNSSWAISNLRRWCCESAALNMPANLGNSAVAARLENVASFQSQREAMLKNAQTTAQLHSSHMPVKFSKPGFNNTWSVNFQMFKLDLEKAQGPEIKLPTCIGSSKMQENSRKTSTSVLLTMTMPLNVWINKKLWKILKDMGIPYHLTCLLWNHYVG